MYDMKPNDPPPPTPTLSSHPPQNIYRSDIWHIFIDSRSPLAPKQQIVNGQPELSVEWLWSQITNTRELATLERIKKINCLVTLYQ